jgi:hypothetical protein
MSWLSRLFGKRDWKVVASKYETWWQIKNGVRTPDFTRVLMLERCTISGEQRAYYYDQEDGMDPVPINVAKIKLGITDTPRAL